MILGWRSVRHTLFTSLIGRGRHASACRVRGYGLSRITCPLTRRTSCADLSPPGRGEEWLRLASESTSPHNALADLLHGASDAVLDDDPVLLGQRPRRIVTRDADAGEQRAVARRKQTGQLLQAGFVVDLHH